MDENTHYPAAWLRSLFGSELAEAARSRSSMRPGSPTPAAPADDASASVRAFAVTTGAPTDPIWPVNEFVDRIEWLSGMLRVLTNSEVDAFRCLTERTAFMPCRRPNGAASYGGATRLLRSADGWLAVSLSRVTDAELLPAFLAVSGESAPARPDVFEPNDERTWQYLADLLIRAPGRVWVDQAGLLGLAVSELGETLPGTDDNPAVRMTTHHHHQYQQRRQLLPADGPPRVVNLSALWAGPLCSRFLEQSGMHVIKVEDPSRPDGGRVGSPGFFTALHKGQEFRSISFRSEHGRAELLSLLMDADVVIEASRPRALQAFGVDAEAVLREGRPRVWLSLTGHGRLGAGAERVAFGDDAAVAGGLVDRTGAGPAFLGDAVADPLTGMVAAAAVLLAWSVREPGSSVLLDVAMARVAATFAGQP